jgi:Cys-tRNA(Pro) deacylase
MQVARSNSTETASRQERFFMSKSEYPITQGVRFLREMDVSFLPHLYTYEEHGGTRASAIELNVPEHQVVKTLVMETDQHKAFLVLMHGDCEVSAKQLARVISVKRVEPCSAATAEKLTGYVFGGTSPFGTRTQLPVYAEKTIFDLPQIYINGGKRGFLVEIDPRDLRRALPITEVEIAVPGSHSLGVP